MICLIEIQKEENQNGEVDGGWEVQTEVRASSVVELNHVGSLRLRSGQGYQILVAGTPRRV